MHIKQIDADLLQDAIRIALRLSPPISGNLTIEAKDGRLYLHSAAELSRCSIMVPCDLGDSEDVLFALPVDALRDATKGRKELSMTLDDTLLNIKGGKYLVKITVQDAIEQDDAGVGKDAQVWKMSAEQMIWLKGAVANIALKPTQNLTTFMPVMVKFTDKSAFVSCVDENHMMFTTTKTINGDLDISLPLETITAVLDVFNKIDCEIRVTNSALYVSNKFVDVVLALPDSRDAIDSSIVRDKAREALRFEGTVVELDKKEVTDFLANAKSVSDKSRPELQVRVEKGSVLLTVQTTIGTAKTKLAATTTADIDFRIDLEYFEEAIKKGKEVKFKYADSFIIVYCTDAYSLISLNQEV